MKNEKPKLSTTLQIGFRQISELLDTCLIAGSSRGKLDGVTSIMSDLLSRALQHEAALEQEQESQKKGKGNG